jgi:hypothetical protein
MALFKPIKNTAANIANVAKKEGQFLVATDTGEAFVDVSNTQRVQLKGTPEQNVIAPMVGSVAYTMNSGGGTLKHLDGSDITINDSYEYIVCFSSLSFQGGTVLIRHYAGRSTVDIYDLDGMPTSSNFDPAYVSKNYADSYLNSRTYIMSQDGVPKVYNQNSTSNIKIVQFGFQGIYSFGFYAFQKLMAVS